MYIHIPDSFTVARDLLCEHTDYNLCGVGDVTLSKIGTHVYAEYGFFADGEPGTISKAEAEEVYKAHMWAEIAVLGIDVALDMFFAHQGIHVFHFGAYGSTHVMSFGHLEDALESAAELLSPCMFTDPDIAGAREEMCASGDLSEDEAKDFDSDEVSDKVYEYATTDMTYTESGYLLSWEWMVTSFDSLQEALEWARARVA